jgi:radical SAM superfamily enzyme YgiQ (UPF0313 family)
MRSAGQPKKVVLVSDIQTYESYLPMSILAIATMAEHLGARPVVLDGQIEEDLPGRLSQELPDAALLGVSAHTGPSITAILKTLEQARYQRPDLPTVWGGYHATLAYRSILDEGLVDFVVKGAGEDAFSSILNATAGCDRRELKGRLASVPNLAFHDQAGLLIDNPIRPVHMSALPPMNYGLIDLHAYLKQRSVIHYISSYGCPYACTFCSEPSQSLRRWSELGPDRLCDEFQHLWETYRPERISLIDPNFSTNPSRVVELVSEMQRRGLKICLNATMRARDVRMIAKRIDLNELREVGFSTIFIGIESGSDRMLKSLRKAATAEDMLVGCVLAHEAGIHVRSSFMHDLPGETEEDSDKTFELVEKICPLNNRQSHHFYMPYPSTELYDSLLDSREIYEGMTQEDWSQTSTFQGRGPWKSRPAFRRRVFERLLALHRQHPESIPDRVVHRLDEESRDPRFRFLEHVRAK